MAQVFAAQLLKRSSTRYHNASMFPVVPCANTSFPVLMTAEKIADAMLQASP
jgi:choline dehydrogenase-like flavoprotein